MNTHTLPHIHTMFYGVRANDNCDHEITALSCHGFSELGLFASWKYNFSYSL